MSKKSKTPKFQMPLIVQTWTQADIDMAKKNYPSYAGLDSVLWGFAVNGIHNPSVRALVEEIKKATGGNG